jgi:hypothetical protein
MKPQSELGSRENRMPRACSRESRDAQDSPTDLRSYSGTRRKMLVTKGLTTKLDEDIRSVLPPDLVNLFTAQ